MMLFVSTQEPECTVDTTVSRLSGEVQKLDLIKNLALLSLILLPL